MVEREVKEVLESYRDKDGKMRYALQGAVIDDGKLLPGSKSAAKKASPQKRGRPRKQV